MGKKRIVFRADANQVLGLGHVSRCLALIDILKSSDFIFLFVIKNTSEKIIHRISETAHFFLLDQYLTLDQELNFLQNEVLSKKDILVIDGYHFSKEYQTSIKPYVNKLVYIDDLIEWPMVADVVFNHGSESSKYEYQKEEQTELYTGFKYVMIRNEFLNAARIAKREMLFEVGAVLICLGGSDQENITFKILSIISGLESVQKIIVITGPSYKFNEKLDDFIAKATDVKIIRYSNLNASEIVDLVQKVQICITPPSTISLEVASVSSGLIVGMTATNQIGILQSLVEKGCAISVGNFNDFDELKLVNAIKSLNDLAKLKNMLACQRENFDGSSAERIVTVFNSFENA
jgi:UDP-2,4-diacetamido-2,4,6-trideoxy-beta-L-altropyranose hydrolase